MTDVARFAGLFRHPLSAVGAWVTTLAGLLFLTFLLLDVLGFSANPYLGIVAFLITPVFFVVGLLLIPIGSWLIGRRQRSGAPVPAAEWPRIDLNVPRQRKLAAVVLLATAANLVIVALSAYRGVAYIDSVAFCGQVCHSVMEPEYVAYQDGPHSRVTCVQCHIGPGAPWFVRSKLSGTRQVFAVAFQTYSKPIPMPVINLRPARDTCEQCHWPEKFHGDQIVEVRSYASDETNTESATTLRLHVGGLTPRSGITTGIHWHVDPGNVVEYVALDRSRQTIGQVTRRDRQGRIVREWFADGVTRDQVAGLERRRMDCIDCHNRPTHPFATSADRAVDLALGRAEISRDLPWIKREAVAALSESYASRDEALAAIASRLSAFYQSSTSRPQADVDRAIRAVQRLYACNVFPAMGVGWGTHINNLGHTDAPGCFRCHDETHRSSDQRPISQDCSLCHTIE
jgi:hypothetical protein